MDRQSTIGMLLIMGLLLLWMQMNKPSEAMIARQKFVKDSTALFQQRADSSAQFSQQQTANQPVTQNNGVVDSNAAKQLVGRYGVFAAAAMGQEKLTTLENDVFKVTFSNKGARIKSV
jgi:YidC/Oxa1 family membrane protein insertase